MHPITLATTTQILTSVTPELTPVTTTRCALTQSAPTAALVNSATQVMEPRASVSCYRGTSCIS